MVFLVREDPLSTSASTSSTLRSSNDNISELARQTLCCCCCCHNFTRPAYPLIYLEASLSSVAKDLTTKNMNSPNSKLSATQSVVSHPDHSPNRLNTSSFLDCASATMTNSWDGKDLEQSDNQKRSVSASPSLKDAMAAAAKRRRTSLCGASSSLFEQPKSLLISDDVRTMPDLSALYDDDQVPNQNLLQNRPPRYQRRCSITKFSLELQETARLSAREVEAQEKNPFLLSSPRLASRSSPRRGINPILNSALDQLSRS